METKGIKENNYSNLVIFTQGIVNTFNTITEE